MIPALFLLAILALAIDGYQTLQIALHPEKWQEVGWAHWWLGGHPTPTGAVMYFLFFIFMCAFVFWRPEIPFAARAAIFVSVLVVEGVTVFNNYKTGIR